MTWEQLHARLREAATTKIGPALAAEMSATMLEAEAAAKRRLGGEVLTPRSGNLRRSLATAVEPDGPMRWSGILRAGGGTKDVRYARIHEEGGTILPKQARALAIPTRLARTQAGVSRVASPRQVADLRMVWPKGSPRGYLVKDIAGGRGRRARTEIWFILVGRVVMPRRPYMAPSVAEAGRGIEGRMVAAVHRVLGLA